jgi:hypothetical protein
MGKWKRHDFSGATIDAGTLGDIRIEDSGGSGVEAHVNAYGAQNALETHPVGPGGGAPEVIVRDGGGAGLMDVDTDGANEAAYVQSNSLASEATLATRGTEATLATRASEATLATRASEATLATRASETTLATVVRRIPGAGSFEQLTIDGTNQTPGAATGVNGFGFQAQEGNAGSIWIRIDGGDASAGGGSGFILQERDFLFIALTNLTNVRIYGDNNNDVLTIQGG